ncbi:MAG: adenine phosphoribosyltransferase [Flavobacteriales bacterium]|nr:adenine phosphoribosyltransferase [Flavobacteriales bacterium]
MEALSQKIKNTIIDVHDFPKPGIVYKDITPIFQSAELSNEILDTLAEHYRGKNIEGVAGLESRGFLFGMPLAMRLGVPFIMMRKKNKLPRERYSVNYSLEYGQNVIEMHTDAVKPGQRILIHDDVLATGGTARAAANLIHQANGVVAGFSFLVELSFLKGEQTLSEFTDEILTFARF